MIGFVVDNLKLVHCFTITSIVQKHFHVPTIVFKGWSFFRMKGASVQFTCHCATADPRPIKYQVVVLTYMYMVYM